MLIRIALLLCLLLPALARADTYLLMAEEHGCAWCKRWNEEIAHIYPKTVEGRVAPLRRYDVHGPQPEIELEKRVHFTPTFILVQDGREVGRIEGYPGEVFFWGLLAMIFKNADLNLEPSG